MASLAETFSYVQHTLFPRLAETLEEPLTRQHQELIWVFSVLRIEEVVADPWRWHHLGRVPLDRRKILRALLVKAWLGLEQTRDLLDRLRVDRMLRTLCGWQPGERLPSASTFSRALAELANSGLLDQLHALRTREYLGDSVTTHVSRDSTAIVARERDATPPKPPKVKGRRGPRPKDAPPLPARRLVRQTTQTAAEAIAELPMHCGMGCKRHGCGLVTAWRGYKLHIDVSDESIPLAAVTTSAAVHDSQVAIPLMRLTSARVRYCYDLMDCGYQGPEIAQVAASLGHVAIVAPQPRRGKAVIPLEPDRQRHYRARTAVERFYSQFKDTGGMRQLWVRGAPKIHATLMLGVLVVFAKLLPTALPG